MKNLNCYRMAVLALLCLSFCIGYAQEEPDINAFIKVDQEPKPENMRAVQMKIGYPQIARAAGIEGTVVLRILVGEKGQYIRHVVLNSAHAVLDRAVVQYVEELSFTPAQKDGEAVKFWVNLPFTFKLIGGKEETTEELKVLEEKNPEESLFSPSVREVFTLFPNPGKGELEISFNHTSQVRIERIQILDQQGKKVFEQKVTFEGKQWNYHVPLPKLTTGTYHVQLLGGEEVWTQQWINK
ncbi:MAG: TonB family protein [Bacteroidota bacterium]